MQKRGSTGVVAFLLTTSLLFPVIAPADSVEKHRLDPMNVQYNGIDINGDEFTDAVWINLVTGEKTLLIGRANGKLERLRVERFSTEEKSTLPDMITEVDLDGDRINDLVVINKEKLKMVSHDDNLFLRVLEYSIYFGQKGGWFRTERFLLLSEEHRALILETARSTLLEP